jgi:hypothetical protein
MTNEKLLELIHGEIDGSNDPAQAEQLREALARDSNAAALRDEMRRLTETLREVGSVDPPENLRSDILRAVGAEPVARSKRSASWRPSRMAAWGYAYTLAAGILIGVVGHSLVAGRAAVIEPANVMGAMTNGSPATVEQRIRIAAGSVDGTVSTRADDLDVLVELDLDGDAPVEVVMSFDPATVSFRGLNQPSGEIDGLQMDGRAIRWTQTGPNRIIVSLAMRDASPSAVDLAFYVADELAHGARVELPGPS